MIAQSFLQSLFAVVGAATGEAEDDRALQANFLQLNKAAQRQDSLAIDALARGSWAAGQQRMEGTRVAAEQTVGFEASGVDSTVGTAVQVSDGTRMMSELNAATVMNNARREAMGHTQAAQQYRDEWAAQVRARDGRRTERAMKVGASFLSMIGGAA